MSVIWPRWPEKAGMTSSEEHRLFLYEERKLGTEDASQSPERIG